MRMMSKAERQVHETISAIGEAWRTGRPADMTDYLHPDIVMKLPGTSGQIVGRDALIDSFKEFCTNAKVLEYRETDEQITVEGKCAVASFSFEMLYERATYRERSKGRDLWVFERDADRWIAVWRTMVDLDEAREPQS
jgi:ketosteroid isomerase-like protein